MAGAFAEPRKSLISGQFLTKEPRWGYMITMGFMIASFSAVESITNLMIPLTCRKFTDNAMYIAWIISLNRLFGFLVQPYVAWKSDHIQTRFGRRRPFLMIGLPATMVSVLVIGALPYIFTGEMRYTTLAMVVLVLANVALQFFQDMNGGVNEPLYADTFKQEKLGRAVALRSYANMVVLFTMNALAMMAVVKYGEWFPYALCAFWLAVAIAVLLFVVRERPYDLPATKERYNPYKHISLLFHNMDYLKISLIASLGLILPAALMLFNTLYITSQLGLSLAVLGQAAIVGPLITLCMAFPVGYMVDRFGPKYLMIVGFFLMTLVSAGMAFWAHDRWSIIILMNVNHISGIFFWTSMTPIVFQYAGPKERGTVFGLIQFVRGLLTWVVTLSLGAVVQFSYSYSPTPFYPDDMKKAADLVKRLDEAKDPVSQFVGSQLSEETRALMRQPMEAKKGAAPELKAALAADFNRISKGEAVYSAERFGGIELSGQSRKMLSQESLSPNELYVLNRTLLTDAFAEEVSKKLNYRATYYVNIIFGFLAILLVLSTKKGKFAKTIGEAKEA